MPRDEAAPPPGEGRPARKKPAGPPRGRPSAGSGRPSAGAGRPERPARPDGGRPASGGGRPASGGGRPASGGGRPAAGRGDRPERPARPDGGRPPAGRAERPGGAREDRSSRARREAGPAPRLTDEQRAEIAARYDPRREKRRQEARVPLPDDVDPRMLDQEARTELRSLAKDTADLVARHLVMAGRLVDDDPQSALTHARAARALAGRVGAVREAAGVTAYLAGEWADALSELRTARRITGRADHLHVMADCERALGRPERALTYGDDPAVPSLDQQTRVELVIVLSGARRDLGQPEAGVVVLQDPARRTTAKRPWAARLWYAYADALLAAGREEEARDWFSQAADVDGDGETDAADRLLELDGVILDEPEEHEDEDAATDLA
jgi:tetratricopeptide (TPR) repeat protein